MNNTTTTLDPLTADDIAKMSPEELKEALAKRIQQHKADIQKAIDIINEVSADLDTQPVIDPEVANKEDEETMKKLDQELDYDINDANLDLATDDKVLKDIE